MIQDAIRRFYAFKVINDEIFLLTFICKFYFIIIIINYAIHEIIITLYKIIRNFYTKDYRYDTCR